MYCHSLLSAQLWQKNKRESWIKVAFQPSVALLKYLESEANEFTFLLKTHRFPNALSLWKNMSPEYIRGGKRKLQKRQASWDVHSQKTMDSNQWFDQNACEINWIPLSKCNICKPCAWNPQTKNRWNICLTFPIRTLKSSQTLGSISCRGKCWP